MEKQKDLAGCLEGKLLLAMPSMTDPRFERSVIYICSHSDEGAMGLVINHPIPDLTFCNLLEQLDIEGDSLAPQIPVHAGGPVDTGRGFVLHSPDFVEDTSVKLAGDVALTATVDILKALAGQGGPEKHIVILGYAGWGPGQLEDEFSQNAWLSADPTGEVLFETADDQKWPRAMASLGVDIAMLSSEAGHA
jgi:putative transcriptional regulator